MGKSKNLKTTRICYEYKDGRFLESTYSNRTWGEHKLTLTKELTDNCVYATDCKLSDLLTKDSVVYDESGERIVDTLKKSDFARNIVNLTIIIKTY